MENYEKKYKEALETARKINSGEGVAAPKGWSTLEVIFPELKESEDERIRKEIIHLIKKSNEYGGYALHKDEADRMISWLEKQNEQKLTNKKPKFKVGDWIVRDYSDNTKDVDRVVNVIPLDDGTYGYALEDDTYFSDCYEDKYRLWTIQDAEDGDILMADDFILIFKEIKYHQPIDGYCFYCHYDMKSESFKIDKEWFSLAFGTKYQPATKEQRSILFEKMEEVGYKWIASEKRFMKLPWGKS